jgi:hypothetical protein
MWGVVDRLSATIIAFGVIILIVSSIVAMVISSEGVWTKSLVRGCITSAIIGMILLFVGVLIPSKETIAIIGIGDKILSSSFTRETLPKETAEMYEHLKKYIYKEISIVSDDLEDNENTIDQKKQIIFE